MPPRLCCCGAGCEIFTDSFTRADNASLGSDWTEYPSSAFEVFSNQVKSVDGGIAICNTIHPTPSGSMVASIDTVDEHEGDVYDVLVNVKDDQNYHRARFNRNDSSTSTIELWVVLAGVPTLKKTETIISLTGTHRTFTALIADNEFCAYVTFSVVSMTYDNVTLISGGYYSGFGTPQSDLLIDNFYFGHHLQTLAGCPSCVCQCDDYYAPPILNLHLEGTGRLVTLNCDITLRWNRSSFYWEGSGSCCGIDWDVILNCGADGGSWDTFSLQMVGTQCATGDTGTRAPSEGSCNPFVAVFGPYYVPPFDLACICDGHGAPDDGTWTATITEHP